MGMYVNKKRVVAVLPKKLKGILTVKENGTYDVSNYSEAIVSVGDSTIVLELPEELQKSLPDYYLAVNSDKLLLSVGSGDTGLWRYVISTKTFTQLYNKGHKYDTFQQVSETKWLISSSDSWANGLLLYDSSNDSCVVVHEQGGTWRAKQTIGTRWLIQSYGVSGFFIFDSKDNTLTQVYNLQSGWYTENIIELSDTLWLMSPTNGKGLISFNPVNETITELYDVGSAWKYSFKVSESKFLLGGSTQNSGILLYDKTNNTAKQVFTTGYSWKYFYQVPNGNVLIASLASNTLGILLYNSLDDTVVQLYASGYYWSNFYTLRNGNVLITSSNSSAANRGVLLYASDNTINKVYEEGYDWRVRQELDNGNVLLSATNSNSKGILLYDTSSNICTQIYASNYEWVYFYRLSNGSFLISGERYSGGLLLFDVKTNVFTQMSSYYGWTQCVPIDETRYLLSNTPYTSGVYLYNTESNSFTRIYSNGRSHYFYKLSDTLWVISSSDKSYRGTFYYDTTTGTARDIFSSIFWGVYKYTTEDNINYYFESESEYAVVSWNIETRNSRLIKYVLEV